MARSRRRKSNSLLMRIIGISVLVHIIVLPIAAYFGAFKNIGKGAGESHIVMLTNSTKDSPDKPKTKGKPKKASVTKKSANADPQAKTKGSNLPQPKVVTSGPPSGSGTGDGSPTAQSGTGVAGKVPEVPKSTEKKPETPTDNEKPKTPDQPPTKKPDIPKVPESKPESVKEPVNPVRITQAEVIDSPQPEIPEDLRAEPFEATLVVNATIDETGRPIDVKIATSTGKSELDKIGLETAKKYRFKAALVNGVATEQAVRFKIIFKVE